MTNFQIIFIVVGGILFIMGATGLIDKTSRGRRFVNLVGAVPARMIYIIFGIAAIVYGYLNP